MLDSLLAAFLQDPNVAPESAQTRPLTVAEAPWEFGLSAFYVDPPGSGEHATTVLYVDRGPLHLEGRYQYEDLDTVSIFAGWTFEVGDEVHAAITPMIGGIFGDTNGIAPGLLVDAGWTKLSFYTEMEYVFDVEDSDDDYFYAWSTLMWHFSEVIAAGVVTERSRLVDTDLSLQRGLALQISPGPVGFALYAYNLGSDDEYFTLSMDLSF